MDDKANSFKPLNRLIAFNLVWHNFFVRDLIFSSNMVLFSFFWIFLESSRIPKYLYPILSSILLPKTKSLVILLADYVASICAGQCGFILTGA